MGIKRNGNKKNLITKKQIFLDILEREKTIDRIVKVC